MKHTLIRHYFLDHFDELFAPLSLLAAQEEGGALIIEVDTGKKHLRFRCLEVNRGTPNLLESARRRMSLHGVSLPGFPALVAPRLSAKALEICAQAGVSCFDLGGNVLVCCQEAQISQTGNQSRYPNETSLFSGKAARVVRTLLVHPQRTWSVRDLGQEAQTSIGLVSQVTQKLTQLGWVTAKRARGGIQLTSPGALIDVWRQHYVPDITATASLFSLDGSEEVEQRLAQACDRLNLQYAFTGSSAAALQGIINTHQEVVLYVHSSAPLKSLITAAGLLRFTNTEGNILLLIAQSKSFLQGARKTTNGWVVHPIQAYMDLWADPEQQSLAALFREATLDF
jgi:hypothetical protein